MKAFADLIWHAGHLGALSIPRVISPGMLRGGLVNGFDTKHMEVFRG